MQPNRPLHPAGTNVLVEVRVATGPGGTVTFTALLRKPSAFAPLAMSVAALGLIVAVVTGLVAVTPQPDEGTAARLFQFLIVLQVPVAAFFAGKWLPRAPRQALVVLALQLGAALLPVATIIWLEG